MSETATVSGSIESCYLEDRDRIVDVFKTLRDQRVVANLRFPGIDTSYTGCVLDVTKKQFLLEDVKPRSGHLLLREDRSFSLSARADGMYLHVDQASVTRIDAERGVPYYLVPLPKKVLYQQRRRAARFRLPLSVAANGATILFERRDKVVGNIIDISAGGCRVGFDPPVDPPFADNERIERCVVEIPHLVTVAASAVVRHQERNDRGGARGCGVEFTEMGITDRRRLEQFIQTIARVAPKL